MSGEDKSDEHTSEHSFGEDGITVSSKSSGVTSGLAMARIDKNNNLKKLGWIMFFTTLFAMVVMFTQLGVLNRQLSDYRQTLQGLDGAGGVSHSGIRLTSLALEGYQIGLYNASGQSYDFPWTTKNYAGYMTAISTNSYLFGNDVKSLYWGDSDSEPFTTSRRYNLKVAAGFKLSEDPKKAPMNYDQFDHKLFNKHEVRNFFNEAKWNESLFLVNPEDSHATNLRLYTLIDLWNFCMQLANAAYDLASTPIETYSDPVAITKKYFANTFAFENIPEIARGTRNLQRLFADHVLNEINTIITSCIAMKSFVVSVLLLVFACILFFRPVVNNIFQYKLKTLCI